MPNNTKKTSSTIASQAAQVLKHPNASAIQKSLADLPYLNLGLQTKRVEKWKLQPQKF
jgi:hypothetical protein